MCFFAPAGSRKDYLVQPSPRISSLPTPGANVLVLDGESLTAEGLMRIHADRSDNYVECVLSDKAWDRIRVGRDVIDRAIASGKVQCGDMAVKSYCCHNRLATRLFMA